MTMSSTARPVSFGHGYAVVDGRVLSGDDMLAAIAIEWRSSRLAQSGGAFAACVAAEDGLVAITDRFGAVPIYYGHIAGSWIVGTDPWEVARTVGATRLNPASAVEMLVCRTCLGDGTLIDGVREVPPGATVEFSTRGAPSITRYWRYSVRPAERSGSRLTAELGRVFELMAERSIEAGARVGLQRWGVNLTAGRDSRVIAFGLHRGGIPFECFSSDLGDDASVASRVAAALGVKHTVLEPWSGERDADGMIVARLCATSAFAVAGHPLALARSRPHEVDGFASGHLGVVGRRLSLEAIRAARGSQADLHAYVNRYNTAVRDPELLRSALRPQYRALATRPTESLTSICAEADDGSSGLQLILRVDLELRKRRYILADYWALRTLGPSVLWFADPAWSDFWSTVPWRWHIGGHLYSRGLFEHFARVNDGLAHIPTNGSLLRRTRFPRLRWQSDETVRRLRKRLTGPNRIATRATVRLTDRELEQISWLCEPAALRESLPAPMIYSLKSIAAATARAEAIDPVVMAQPPRTGSNAPNADQTRHHHA